MYKCNPAFQVMPVDESSVVVFDPESGDSHILDGTGKQIFELCDGTKSLDVIIEELLLSYKDFAEEIRKDVPEFIDEMLAKAILVE